MILFDASTSPTGSIGRYRVYGPMRRTVKGRELRTWQVRIYDRRTGSRSWRSTGQLDFRAACAWAEEFRLAALRPTVKRRKKTGSVTPRILTHEEEERLLAVADPVWHSLIVFAVETGLRGATLLRIEDTDIDLETGYLTLSPEKLKSRQNLRVPLSDRARSAVSRHSLTICVDVGNPQSPRRLWPLSPVTFGRLFSRLVRRAGIDHLTFHDLRRTFATRLRQRGTPIEVALALGDWRDQATFFKAYRSVTPEELEHAVRS